MVAERDRVPDQPREIPHRQGIGYRSFRRGSFAHYLYTVVPRLPHQITTSSIYLTSHLSDCSLIRGASMSDRPIGRHDSDAFTGIAATSPVAREIDRSRKRRGAEAEAPGSQIPIDQDDSPCAFPDAADAREEEDDDDEERRRRRTSACASLLCPSLHSGLRPRYVARALSIPSRPHRRSRYAQGYL